LHTALSQGDSKVADDTEVDYSLNLEQFSVHVSRNVHANEYLKKKGIRRSFFAPTLRIFYCNRRQQEAARTKH
jgi:hypothetical protein